MNFQDKAKEFLGTLKDETQIKNFSELVGLHQTEVEGTTNELSQLKEKHEKLVLDYGSMIGKIAFKDAPEEQEKEPQPKTLEQLFAEKFNK